MEDADLRFVDLAEQIGKEVKLDGKAREWYGHWWFEYRGERLYVENQKDLPGWTDDFAWRDLTISGTLERAQLPDLDQIEHKEVPLRDHYLIRRASWSPLDFSWNKPPAIPKAPPLTSEYLESYGIKFEGRWQKRFEEAVREGLR